MAKTPEEIAAEENAAAEARAAEETAKAKAEQEAKDKTEADAVKSNEQSIIAPQEQEVAAKPVVQIKQRDELNRVLEAQNTNLKYDISEVMSKIPNNKGFGYSDDKLVFVSQDGDLLDSKEVIRTMDAGYKLTKEAYGEAVAKLSTNALARSADQGFKFTPDDIYNAWEKSAKDTGLLSEEYNPESTVNVVAEDEDLAFSGRAFDVAVKTTSAQIQNGTGFNAAVAYGLSLLSQDESFQKMGDAAKVFYAKKLVSSLDEVRKSAEGAAVVKNAQAWTEAEQQAHKEIGGGISLLPEDFTIQLSPQEKLVAETNATTWSENSAKAEAEAVKLTQQADKEEQDLGAIRRNYPQALKGLIEKGLSESEANIRLQNLFKEKTATIKSLRDQAQAAGNSSKMYQQSAEKALSFATKGLPYGLKAKDTERIVGGIVGNIDALSSPVALAEAMHVTGSRGGSTVDYGSMSPSDQYAFFLEHGVNQWLSDYAAKDPNKKEVGATIRAKLMDQFNKTGSVAGISPDMDTAIRRQMQSAMATRQNQEQQMPKTAKESETMVQDLLQKARRGTQIFTKSGTEFNAAGDAQFLTIDTVGELEDKLFSPLERIAIIQERPDLRQAVAELRAQANGAIEKETELFRIASKSDASALLDAEELLVKGKVNTQNLADTMMTLLSYKDPKDQTKSVETSFGFRAYYAGKLMQQAADNAIMEIEPAAQSAFIHGLTAYKKALGALAPTEQAMKEHMKSFGEMKQALVGVKTKEEAEKISQMYSDLMAARVIHQYRMSDQEKRKFQKEVGRQADTKDPSEVGNFMVM
jgi:hypothetical protein